MRTQMKNGGFHVRRVVVTEHGCSYPTFQVVGYLAGERLRRRFKSRELALGEKNRLDVMAANGAGGFHAVNTRLTMEQVTEAEALIRRLAGKSLSEAVEWYLANYRPPVAAKPLGEAMAAFLAARKGHVEAVYHGELGRALKILLRWFPRSAVHEITAAAILQRMEAKQWAPKTWNNERATLSAFFDFCRHELRRWTSTNPMTLIEPRKVVRGLPAIESAARLADLFAFLETYTGGPRRPHKPGFLVPYFTLATFAGLRPAVPGGEIWKIGKLKEPARVVDSAMGVIRIPPEIAKTDSVRQIKIQPNLSAWLARYPLSDYPVTMPNLAALVADVRKKFALGDDTLRHTFISAAVAKFKSLGEAALEAGNSETMIRRHYLNLMSEAETAAFWSIVPKA